MAELRMGDVITTAEELDALPQGCGVVDRDGMLWQDPSEWVVGNHGPVTLVYLPGQPPRPERVVKAEALREAAESLFYSGDTDHARPGYYLLVGLAERIERGEP